VSDSQSKALPISEASATSNTAQQSRRDSSLAYLTGRAIKLFANSLRPLFYCHYKLFPNQRFSLKTTKELWPNRRQILDHTKRLIPRIIWQTNYTEKVSLPIIAARTNNRILAPNYQHIFVSDEECSDYVKIHCPARTFDLYRRLRAGAAKSDLWRLLVLYREGGIYMDIDAHLIYPLDRIITPGTSELFLYHGNNKATNYFIASEPGNPTLKALINEALKRIEKAKKKTVYHLTGPGLFQSILAKRAHTYRYCYYTCMQNNFSNKFFQYIDKPTGHWKTEQSLQEIVGKEGNQD